MDAGRGRRELKKETVEGEKDRGVARRLLRGWPAAAASAAELRQISGADLISGDGEK